MSAKAIDALSPLAAELRANDPDRYTATLFAPPASRESLIALYAFDHELSRLRSLVREPMAGLIRLQWWDEVVGELAGGKAIRHPVVQGLERAVAVDGLDIDQLKRAIEGRRRPFEDDQPENVPAFEDFLQETGGAIARTAAALLGAGDEAVLALAERAGLVRAAWEQCRLLDIPSADHQPWLPSLWREGSDRGALAAARQGLADLALKELAEARRRQRSATRPVLAAFFPATLAGLRLRSPRRSRQAALPGAVPTLIWHWMRGRF